MHRSLPIEIWMHIVATLGPDEQGGQESEEANAAALRNLALTCSFFRQLAQPLIFQKLCFSSRKDQTHLVLRVISIAQLLVNREETRYWIKDLAIEDPTFIATSATMPLGEAGVDQLTEILKGIFIMSQSLEVIRIELPRFTKDMLSHIWHLPRLRKVYLQMRNRHAYPVEAEVLDLIPSDVGSLQHLYLFFISSPNPADWLSLTHLVAIPSITHLTVDFSVLYQAYLKFGQEVGLFARLTNLRTLFIDAPLAHRAPILLAACPNLVQLSLFELGAGISWADYELSPLTVPHLQQLEGSWSLIEWLLPGRPVERLKRPEVYGAEPAPVFENLARGKSPVRYLNVSDIEWGLDTFVAMFTTLTGLEEMELRFLTTVDCLSAFEKICRESEFKYRTLKKLKISQAPAWFPLRELTAEAEAERQSLLLNELRESFPALTSVALKKHEYAFDSELSAWILIGEVPPRPEIWW